jgi:hypothetical protein
MASQLGGVDAASPRLREGTTPAPRRYSAPPRRPPAPGFSSGGERGAPPPRIPHECYPCPGLHTRRLISRRRSGNGHGAKSCPLDNGVLAMRASHLDCSRGPLDPLSHHYSEVRIMKAKAITLLALSLLSSSGALPTSVASVQPQEECEGCVGLVNIDNTCNCSVSIVQFTGDSGLCDPYPTCPPAEPCTLEGTISKKCGPGWVSHPFALTAGCGTTDNAIVACPMGFITVRLDCTPCPVN